MSVPPVNPPSPTTVIQEARELLDLARELLAELDRLKVAYSAGLASDVEPPSMELLARARHSLY